MEIAYWAERWKDGRIGFHEGRANAFLTKFVTVLGTSANAGLADGEGVSRPRILVPLCGKTEDMAFLVARGFEVIGIEAVESACVDFFREHGLAPTIEDHSGAKDGFAGKIYRAPSIAIFVGDFFAVPRALVGEVDAFYDRAAMVALPPDVRPRYAEHLRGLVTAEAKGLVVTFEYDATKMSGPPFSVDANELRAIYGEGNVQELGQGPADGPRFREAGTTALERCFAVRLA